MTETTVSAVRLSGRLPKGEANGLDSLLTDLLTTPKTVRYAVVAYHVPKIIDITEDNERFPVLGIDRFEPIVNVDHVQQLIDAMRAATLERTGSAELPFDEDGNDGAQGHDGDAGEWTDDLDAERMAAAAEEHVAAHPDSVIAKGIKTTKAEKVTDLFKAPAAT